MHNIEESLPISRSSYPNWLRLQSLSTSSGLKVLRAFLLRTYPAPPELQDPLLLLRKLDLGFLSRAPYHTGAFGSIRLKKLRKFSTRTNVSSSALRNQSKFSAATLLSCRKFQAARTLPQRREQPSEEVGRTMLPRSRMVSFELLKPWLERHKR